MRTATWGLLAVLLAFPIVALAGEAPPRTLLHIPFDGTTDATFSATGELKTSAVYAVFGQGKRGQAAEVGSERYPCGLVVRGPSLLRKERGSVSVWYQPSWDPSDRAQQAVTRTLLTDEKPAMGVGHFWLTIAQGGVHFAWRGRSAEGVSATYTDWDRGSWHHIVATWDQDKGLALYLDGDRAAARALRWRLPPSDTLYIGANRRGLNRADGLLDELHIYDRALTPQEVELAFVHNLNAPNAAVTKPGEEARPRRPKPRLTLHVPFDENAVAAEAAGTRRPAVAKGVQFAGGLLGNALLATRGIDLAYVFDKNVSREAGAITFWTRAAAAEAAGPRGVLLADEQPPAKEDEKATSILGLWLKRMELFRVEDKILGRPVVPTLNFDMVPASLQYVLYRWNNTDWHHVALCWRQGEEMSLYLNGRLVARRLGSSAAWPTEGSELLHVGSWQGQMVAESLLDDLRVYDAPLPPEQIEAEANRFLLPLVLQLRRTFFELGLASELVLDIHSASDEKLSLDLDLLVLDPTGNQVASTTTRIRAEPHGHAEAKLALPREALAVPGLYRVNTASPNRVNTPITYFLVAGSERKEGPTSGDAAPRPRHKVLDTIECEKVTQAERVCHSGRSQVKETALGSYREAGPFPNDRFAYRFSVDVPQQPHVAVVTYPDDRERSAEILITSPNFPNASDVATGYFTSSTPSGRMAELPVYFWPRERDNAIIFRTLEVGRPAACAKVEIRQLTSELPSTRVEPPADGGRAIGLWWSDPAVPLEFGAQTLVATDVYISFVRLISYLRFTGQNLLCYPVAWHAGLLYPSPGERFRLGTGADRHCNDWVEYALYLCGRRGVRFVPELFLGSTFALADAYGNQDEDAVAAGAETARTVLWDGSLSRGGDQEPPLYSPVHPAVRDAILGTVDEFLARYGKAPALDGLAFHLGQDACAWFGSLQCGYGDATVAQFEKDTGIRVPSDKTGSARFAQRAKWLLANRQREWVEWRCRKVHELHAEMASRVRKQRPDLKLYLNVAIPDAAAWSPLSNLTGWASGVRTIEQTLREGGLDLALYAKDEGIVVRRVFAPEDDRYLRYQFGGGGPNPHPVVAQDHAMLSEANAPFFPCPLRGGVCAYRRFESAIGRVAPMRGFWWASPAWRASQPTPSGRRFLEPYAHALAELDVTSLAAGGATPITVGREDEVREFARAFRPLPRRPFQDLEGMADPVCARELRDGDRHYLYLVNRLPVPVDAWLAFEGSGVALYDYAAGKEAKLPFVQREEVPAAMPKGFVSEHRLPAQEGPLPGTEETRRVTGSLLRVQLQPFQLRSYRVLTPAARVTYAASRAPVELRVRLAQRIESAKSLVANSRAPQDVVEKARATLGLIERAWRKRELARVAQLLDSYPVERLR